MVRLILLGICLLAGGFYLYTLAAPQWQKDQSLVVQVVSALSPSVRQQIATTRMEYFGSIGAMILGGLLILAGLVAYRAGLGSHRMR
jgi:hypothetical protein